MPHLFGLTILRAPASRLTCPRSCIQPPIDAMLSTARHDIGFAPELSRTSAPGLAHSCPPARGREPRGAMDRSSVPWLHPFGRSHSPGWSTLSGWAEWQLVVQQSRRLTTVWADGGATGPRGHRHESLPCPNVPAQERQPFEGTSRYAGGRVLC